jgi:hypothetical protein
VTPSGFSEYHMVAICWEIWPRRRYVLWSDSWMYSTTIKYFSTAVWTSWPA